MDFSSLVFENNKEQELHWGPTTSIRPTLALFGILLIALLAKLSTNEVGCNIFQMFMPRKVREQENEISAKLVSRNR